MPAIKVIEGVSAGAKAFEDASRQKPVVLRTQKEAAEYFGEEELVKLAEAVDFEKQVVLVFAWRGSRQDRLEYEVAESSPEQVTFSLKPGLTRDLRPHVKIFALRANVKWRMKGDGRAKG